ncbi:kti12, chromatin associated [Aspergillus melleus]|uniref:Kti12, chromatin associated n=1 Tax=Aspergillus melleus TaxID=138277 RepID=A0ACC3BDW1_9EURO|nr:kti12, chromatin associated [Aspergillus melleus]
MPLTSHDELQQHAASPPPNHDASHPRTVHDHARTEKEARGVAYTRAKFLLSKDSFVILDGIEIYQGISVSAVVRGESARDYMLCGMFLFIGYTLAHWLSNASRTTKCASIARKNRATRRTRTKSPTTIPRRRHQQQAADTTEPNPPDQNLIFRYEEPSTHSRWDKPLFTVPLADAESPVAEIWSAFTGIPYPSISETDNKPSILAPSFATTHISSTSSTADGSKAGFLAKTQIQPHQATMQPTSTSSFALYDMEKQTSAIISAVRTFTLFTPSAEAS